MTIKVQRAETVSNKGDAEFNSHQSASQFKKAETDVKKATETSKNSENKVS